MDLAAKLVQLGNIWALVVEFNYISNKLFSLKSLFRPFPLNRFSPNNTDFTSTQRLPEISSEHAGCGRLGCKLKAAASLWQLAVNGIASGWSDIQPNDSTEINKLLCWRRFKCPWHSQHISSLSCWAPAYIAPAQYGWLQPDWPRSDNLKIRISSGWPGWHLFDHVCPALCEFQLSSLKTLLVCVFWNSVSQCGTLVFRRRSIIAGATR